MALMSDIELADAGIGYALYDIRTGERSICSTLKLRDRLLLKRWADDGSPRWSLTPPKGIKS